MNIRRICIAGLMAVAAFNAWGAGSAPASAGKTKIDVSGTWNATQQMGSMSTKMVFVFKQDKEKLTGTMSTNGAPAVEIMNAKVYKTKITFAVETTMPAMAMPGQPAPPANAAPRKVTTRYEATVDGDTMTIETVGGGRGGMGGGMGGGGMGGGGGGGGMPMGGGGGGGGMGPPAGGGGGMGGGGMRMGGMGMGKITATREK